MVSSKRPAVRKRRGPLRAVRAEDKAERAAVFVAAAAALFRARGYAAVRMADVATEARLAKGTLFLYFKTKESLFLAVLRDLLEAWLMDLERALDDGGRWSSARVARAIAASLAEHGSLVELLALLSSVLERNAEEDDIARFKAWLAPRLSVAGAALEKRLPFLHAGAGARVLLHVDAVVVGLHQLASPGPAAAAVLARPELRGLRVDFAVELVAVLTAYFEGLRAAHGGDAAWRPA